MGAKAVILLERLKTAKFSAGRGRRSRFYRKHKLYTKRPASRWTSLFSITTSYPARQKGYQQHPPLAARRRGPC